MVQHTHTAEMDQEFAAIKDAFIASLTLEERLSGLSQDDPEYIVLKESLISSLTPEERIAGLPPDTLLDALSVEQRRRLFEILCQRGFKPE